MSRFRIHVIIKSDDAKTCKSHRPPTSKSRTFDHFQCPMTTTPTTTTISATSCGLLRCHLEWRLIDFHVAFLSFEYWLLFTVSIHVQVRCHRANVQSSLFDVNSFCFAKIKFVINMHALCVPWHVLHAACKLRFHFLKKERRRNRDSPLTMSWCNSFNK